MRSLPEAAELSPSTRASLKMFWAVAGYPSPPRCASCCPQLLQGYQYLLQGTDLWGSHFTARRRQSWKQTCTLLLANSGHAQVIDPLRAAVSPFWVLGIFLGEAGRCFPLSRCGN